MNQLGQSIIQQNIDAIAGELNVSSIPNQVQTELTSEEFWGATTTIIHNKCVAAIEVVTGEGTCTIVQG